ncbi:aminodeoxychorismate lyase [Vibrio azureus]|uniref:Aminodeoxychorismate lyase n=1 Tax=Vibrio azureus NBRC 104587 TaxID=1219077 RepID=U3AK15_9VIBR|nr:aminodeoxychorismate lyase [Vibrio azureus]AUI86468.1 aminodeoxychorismate lyase [Vibrio azureus]GAD74080.1 aminodeoxychorismate lyase [Vibrio azureus NBRC 104587]
MFLVNGMPHNHVPIGDRSFQYGDGCFTTILTKQGKLVFWSEHIARLEACLHALHIPIPDWQQVLDWINQLVLSDGLGGIKIHISRGEGGRGYSPAGLNHPMVTVTSFNYPSHYLQWQENGLALGICQTQLGIQPMLAGHKHNNRLEQVMAKAELEGSGLADAVMLNINHHLIETTMANLFWLRDNQVYTPDLSLSGVAGVMRRKVLTNLQSQGYTTHIGMFTLDDLVQAEEVWICNALLGVAPITHLSNPEYNRTFLIGKLTRQLQRNLNT